MTYKPNMIIKLINKYEHKKFSMPSQHIQEGFKNRQPPHSMWGHFLFT